MNKRGFSTLAVVLIVIVILAGIIGYFTWRKISTAPAVRQSSTTQVPTSAASSSQGLDTSSWITHHNDQEGFTILYPPSQHIITTSTLLGSFFIGDDIYDQLIGVRVIDKNVDLSQATSTIGIAQILAPNGMDQLFCEDQYFEGYYRNGDEYNYYRHESLNDYLAQPPGCSGDDLTYSGDITIGGRNATDYTYDEMKNPTLTGGVSHNSSFACLSSCLPWYLT